MDRARITQRSPSLGEQASEELRINEGASTLDARRGIKDKNMGRLPGWSRQCDGTRNGSRPRQVEKIRQFRAQRRLQAALAKRSAPNTGAVPHSLKRVHGSRPRQVSRNEFNDCALSVKDMACGACLEQSEACNLESTPIGKVESSTRNGNIQERRMCTTRAQQGAKIAKTDL